MTTCYVYAACTAGRKHYLEPLFAGTRQECREYVAARTRNNQPTQFIEISSLGIVPATQKFCDGARWDPLAICYYD